MNRRIEQLNSTLLRGIALYAEEEVNAGNFLITITYVSVTADLSSAKVGVKTFPSSQENIKQALSMLKKNRYSLQLKMARDHKLRNIPVFIFLADINDTKVDKVEELLDRVTRERR